MKIVCEECGSILVSEKEYWELTPDEKERERIINYEHQYKEDRDEFIQSRMRVHLGEMIRLQMMKTEVMKKWKQELTNLSTSIVKDFKRWESGHSE